MDRSQYQRTLQKHQSIALAASENMDINIQSEDQSQNSQKFTKNTQRQIQNYNQYNGILKRQSTQQTDLNLKSQQQSGSIIQKVDSMRKIDKSLSKVSGELKINSIRNIRVEDQKKKQSISPVKKIKANKKNTILDQKKLIDQINNDSKIIENDNQEKQRIPTEQSKISQGKEETKKQSKYQQGSLPLQDKKYHYFGGTQPYEIIVKMRGMEYNEQVQNQYEPYQILDSQCILAKSQEDISNHRQILQNLTKDKILQFNMVYQEKSTNEQVYRHSFNNVCKNFLNAQNQSIIFFGGENSGKSRAVFGNLRDAGFIPILLKDLFNELYDSPDCEEIIFKFSYINFDVEKGEFHDLLVNTKHPLQLTEDSISDIHLLGASECIVNNLKTALKLYRSALLNLYGDVQGTPEEQIKISESNFIMQVKAELPPKDSMGSETYVSKLRVVKICSQEQNRNHKKRKFEKDEGEEKEQNVPQALRKVLKTLSDFTNKTKKNSFIPYKINPLMEYLIECLSGNSYTYLYLCINNLAKYSQQTLSYLRSAQHAQNINTNPVNTKVSFINLEMQYQEIKEEVRKTLYVWLMEFGHNEQDQKKKNRQYMIFTHLNKIEQIFQNILPYYENLALLNSQLNSLYANILQNYCQAFSKQITCENLQEFYLAKLQGYLVNEIRSTNAQQIYFCNLIIEEIVECRIKINQLFKNLKKSLVLWENKDKKPQFINNYDVEKFVVIGRLCKKWLEILDNFANYNHYDPEKYNSDFVQIFQRTKQVFIDLQNQDENNMEDQGYNMKYQNNFNNSGQKNNPFQEQEDESDNNITNQYKNESLSSVDKIEKKDSSKQNFPSPKKIRNTEMSDQNVNTSKSININNLSISMGDKQNSSNQLQKQHKSKKQQLQELKDAAQKMLDRIKQRLTDTKHTIFQRQIMKDLQNQDFFYVKNHKIRTGKHYLQNIKKQKRIQTLQSEESIEIDDDLVKNLFSSDLLKIKSKVFEQQYSGNKDTQFNLMQRAQSTQSINYKPYQTSNNIHIPTNSTQSKPFYINKSQKKNFKTQDSPQLKHRNIKGLNQNSQNTSRNSLTKNIQIQQQDIISVPQTSLNSPSQKSQLQYIQKDSIASISKQDFSEHRHQVFKQSLNQQKFNRNQNQKQPQLPVLIGIEKFKFTLPKIEHSSLTDQIMCNKFNILNNQPLNNNINSTINFNQDSKIKIAN